ncbi:MAG: MauE/DoxX family redox-associated membrane protein [Desulfobulbaceae bacterium]|nr:MauE/DoxX family redox-associated membrane protein [Desulfobulbaceae bacterium]
MPAVSLRLIQDADLSLWLYRVVRWILAALFVWAGSMKLADPQAFAVTISDFGLVPGWSIMPIAIVLPAVEVIAALGLLLDIRGSLAVITGLLILFIAILGFGLWLGLDIDCGCFGPEDPESRAYSGLRPALYRDLIMGAGILFLYRWRGMNKAGSSNAVNTD